MVRWGIVGTGNIANKFAKAVKNADNAKLVAVASRTKESANTFGDKYDIEKRFGSYKGLADFDGVDAVYIALPHIYHAPVTKLFMTAGKHVLCEKPITINEKELTEIIDLAKNKKVYVMEALWTRFLPTIIKIKEMVGQGIIGEVLEISADFCYNDSANLTARIFNNSYAGGSLLDVGIYGLNFASIILGDKVIDVKSAAKVNNGVDEHINVLLTYENGAIAKVSSAITLEKPATAYIYGTKGYIRVPVFFGPSEFEVTAQGQTTKYEVPFKGNGFEEEIEECNKNILNGKNQSDIMPLSQSLIITKLMDEIRRQIGLVYDAD